MGCRQLACRRLDDLGYGAGNIQRQRMCRWLKRTELRLQKSRWHVAMLSRLKPCLNELEAAAEVHYAQARQAIGQEAAILLAQRRAGQYDGLSLCSAVTKHSIEFSQPGRAIIVGERDTRAHFLDIGRRMKIIGIDKSPAHPFGQGKPDRTFPAA